MSILNDASNGERHLWFLNPKHEAHCSFYEKGDYETVIDEQNIESVAKEFVKNIEDNA